MTQISESGHAKNVACFADLTTTVKGYGDGYNPTREGIKLIALLLVLTNSQKAVEAVNASLPAYARAVASREAAFAPLNKLITRIISALKAIATSDHVHEIALTYARKIQGKRAKARRTEEQVQADVSAGKEITERSAAQTSYDNRLDNLDKLIKLLSTVEEYAPNETDLKITALTTLYADLMLKNQAVITAATPLHNARISRNDVLYKDGTGLVDIALSVKAYIKSVYGATSPQYRQVSKLVFKKF